MKSLSQQGSMGQYVNMSEYWANYIALVFIIAMSLVLWNAGLLGGLRRYGEVGVRLAMGEEKGHVYRTMIYESIMIGIAGSVIGTFFGLFFAWLIQKYGIDISGLMKGSSIMMPSSHKSTDNTCRFLSWIYSGTVIYRNRHYAFRYRNL